MELGLTDGAHFTPRIICIVESKEMWLMPMWSILRKQHLQPLEVNVISIINRNFLLRCVDVVA